MERDGRTTIRLPPKLQEWLELEVERRGMRWEDRGVIVIEAISKLFMESDPEFKKQQMREIMRDDPTILDEAIKKLRLEIKPRGS